MYSPISFLKALDRFYFSSIRGLVSYFATVILAYVVVTAVLSTTYGTTEEEQNSNQLQIQIQKLTLEVERLIHSMEKLNVASNVYGTTESDTTFDWGVAGKEMILYDTIGGVNPTLTIAENKTIAPIIPVIDSVVRDDLNLRLVENEDKSLNLYEYENPDELTNVAGFDNIESALSENNGVKDIVDKILEIDNGSGVNKEGAGNISFNYSFVFTNGSNFTAIEMIDEAMASDIVALNQMIIAGKSMDDLASEAVDELMLKEEKPEEEEEVQESSGGGDDDGGSNDNNPVEADPSQIDPEDDDGGETDGPQEEESAEGDNETIDVVEE